MVIEHPVRGLPDGRNDSGATAPEPQRTCVGCRRRGNRSVLLRLVVSEDAGARVVVLDPLRRRPGRGVWLHPDQHCLELARRRSAIARSLRTAGPVDTAPALAQLGALLQDGRAPQYD